MTPGTQIGNGTASSAQLAVGAGPSVVLSPTGLSKFMACEEQWVRYDALPRGEDGHKKDGVAAGEGATRGTAIHTLLAALEAGEDWRALVDEVAVAAAPSWTPEWELPDAVRTAVRLVDRYEKTYTTRHAVVATEFEFRVKHPADRDLEIHGYQDGLVMVSAQDDREHAGLWVVERKSMSRWTRLDWLDDDPQPWTYVWAARAQGLNVRGLLYDAIYTQEWVEERPPSASFRRLWLPYDEAKVARTLDCYARAAVRIREIRAGGTHSLSTGPTCQASFCPFIASCRGW